MNIINKDSKSQQDEVDLNDSSPVEPIQKKRWINLSTKNTWALIGLFAYFFGLISGYGLWGKVESAAKIAQENQSEVEALLEQIHPQEGYVLPIEFGDLGPQMVSAGVIDREKFIQTYQQAGQPLSTEQLAILDGTFQGEIIANQENAYFLLNFLWAVGLSSKNPVLDSGPIQQYGENDPTRFASTGGWTIATKPINEIFSSLDSIILTTDQQKRVEEAAKLVYRPCCNNSTYFPDCNHGMAMLGLFELIASKDLGTEEMLNAAKNINALWFPQQTLEQAIFFQKTDGRNFQDIDARTILGEQFSSNSGFKQLNQFLIQNNWLPQSDNNAGGCGV